jgi:hypothetical protein
MLSWEFLAVVVIGILSVGRTARFIGFDEYPPMTWLRNKWGEKFGTEGWGKLVYCPFCSAPYLALGMYLWAFFALPDSVWGDPWSSAWWWVTVNGIWGLSYLSSILVAYDQPEE